MIVDDSCRWACTRCAAACTGPMPPTALCGDCAAARSAAQAPAAVRRCLAAAACESCAAAKDLWVLEADTPVGVICLTLCGSCADDERTPRLSCPEAVRRAMAHEGHTPVRAAVAS